MKFRSFALLLLSGLFCNYGYAACYEKTSMGYGTPISIDLSDKLSAKNPVWQGEYATQYVGSFKCSGGLFQNYEFAYTSLLPAGSKNPVIIGFNNGKQWVRAEIVNEIDGVKLKGAGTYSASELNQPMTLRFSLVDKKGTAVPGDTKQFDSALLVSDVTGIGPLTWIIKMTGKLLTWILSGFQDWPVDERDMYAQPLILRYAPKMTTCSFDNAGLHVMLPKTGIAQLGKNAQAGYTPFTLNMSCENMQQAGIADRGVDMFLSSNNLLPADGTVLTDKNPDAAQGVGIRLVQTDKPGTPVMLSTSPIDRGNATSLFNVAVGQTLASHFSIRMGAYYYPYDISGATQGEINASATLNIIYD
ncbi:hypothetical protein SM12BL3_33500 [Serratia marcescens]|nr:hypothetical protein SM12BL3_33500 [Serratia marcescens]